MPTANLGSSQDLASLNEEVRGSEAKVEPPSRKSRSQTKKCPAKTKATQRPSLKQDLTRERTQKKRATTTQAKKAVVEPRKKMKKAGT